MRWFFFVPYFLCRIINLVSKHFCGITYANARTLLNLKNNCINTSSHYK